MHDGVLEFLGFVAILIVLDVAALCFGADSRHLTRELPLPGEPVMGSLPAIGRHVRARLNDEIRGKQVLLVRPARLRSIAPFACVQPLSRPKRPLAAGDVYGYPHFDLAAAGK